MSIYSGTIGEAEYADGRDQGRAMAERLAEGGFASVMGDVLAEGSEALRTSYSARTRSYWLGWLRGFREVSR